MFKKLIFHNPFCDRVTLFRVQSNSEWCTIKSISPYKVNNRINGILNVTHKLKLSDKFDGKDAPAIIQNKVKQYNGIDQELMNSVNHIIHNTKKPMSVTEPVVIIDEPDIFVSVSYVSQSLLLILPSYGMFENVNDITKRVIDVLTMEAI